MDQHVETRPDGPAEKPPRWVDIFTGLVVVTLVMVGVVALVASAEATDKADRVAGSIYIIAAIYAFSQAVRLARKP